MKLKYKEKYPLIYSIFENSILNNKINHAYLIEIKDIEEGLSIVLELNKMILCTNFKNSYDVNCKCNSCANFDSKKELDIKVIKPDGQTIKKEQVIKLINHIKNKPSYFSKKIYIIVESEKMNIHSFNTILKTLEEPEEDIIAFLITKNIYNNLPTIVSRCQIFRLNNNEINSNDKFNSEFSMFLLKNIEKHGIKTITYLSKDIIKNIKTKDDLTNLIQDMISIYKNIIDIKINNTNNINENVNELIDSNSKLKLIKKINILNNIYISLKYNVNISLTIDKIIISLEGVK